MIETPRKELVESLKRHIKELMENAGLSGIQVEACKHSKEPIVQLSGDDKKLKEAKEILRRYEPLLVFKPT